MSVNNLEGKMVGITFRDVDSSVVAIQLAGGPIMQVEVPQSLAELLDRNRGQKVILSVPIRGPRVHLEAALVKLPDPKSINERNRTVEHEDPFGNRWTVTIAAPDTQRLQRYVQETSIEIFAEELTPEQYQRAVRTRTQASSDHRAEHRAQVDDTRDLTVTVSLLQQARSVAFSRVYLSFSWYPAPDSWDKQIPTEPGSSNIDTYYIQLKEGDGELNLGYEVDGGSITLSGTDWVRGPYGTGSDEVNPPVSVPAGAKIECKVTREESTHSYRLTMDFSWEWNKS